MSNLRQAAQQALKTLESMSHEDSIFAGEFDGEIAALRAALAEPDYWQEEARRYASNADYWRKRYEALAEPRPIHECYGDCPTDPATCLNPCNFEGRPKSEQPVAWVEPKWLDPDTRGWPSDSFESVPIEGWLPLYTAPSPHQEPEQEPVKGVVIREGLPTLLSESGIKSTDVRLYTAPTPRKPLTDEHVEAIIGSWWRDDLKMRYAELCRLIERAHGIGGQT